MDSVAPFLSLPDSANLAKCVCILRAFESFVPNLAHNRVLDFLSTRCDVLHASRVSGSLRFQVVEKLTLPDSHISVGVFFSESGAGGFNASIRVESPGPLFQFTTLLDVAARIGVLAQ